MSYYTVNSVNNPLVYIHIPKTAGKSVLDYLQRVYNKENLQKAEHAPFRELSYLEFPSFTTVRNPYDRTLSLYKEYFRLLTDQNKKSKIIDFNLSFEEYNKGFEHFVDTILPAAISKGVIFDQYYYVDNGADKSLVEYIMHFENLDLLPLKAYCNNFLPIKHYGKGEVIEVSWTRHMLDCINNYFVRDFDFGYEMV